MAKSDMSASEALNILKKVKNHYRAFEKAEEAMAVLANAESSLQGVEGDIKKAEKSKEKALKDAAKAMDEHDQVMKKMAEDRKKMEKDYSDQMKACDGELKARKEALDKQAEEHSAKLQKELDDLTFKIANKRKAEDKLNQSILKLQEQLANLKQAVGAI